MKKNQAVKITTNAFAKKGKLKYKVSVKFGKKTTVLQKYTTKKICTWKPKKAGTYKIIVQVKDGTKKVVKKTITVKVKKK